MNRYDPLLEPPKGPPEGPRERQDGPKMALGRPKTAPRQPKTAPRRLQDGMKFQYFSQLIFKYLNMS